MFMIGPSAAEEPAREPESDTMTRGDVDVDNDEGSSDDEAVCACEEGDSDATCIGGRRTQERERTSEGWRCDGKRRQGRT